LRVVAPRRTARKVSIMSENTTAASDLASQYAAQVTGDLERNVKEQKRVSVDIAALQEQLATLQQDHAVLVNMQQALGVASPLLQPAAPSATVPAPRAKAAPDRAKKGTRTKRATTAAPTPAKPEPEARKSAAGKAAVTAPKASQASKPAAPTLVELVRVHLAEQSEPRSAAEVSAGLGGAHSDRSFKTTVVRNTLENLVARDQAQRSKQGSSVFYTAPEAAEQKTGSPSEETRPEPSA
jgi:hypothetical protein